MDWIRVGVIQKENMQTQAIVLIAHRGNTDGSNRRAENYPAYVQLALNHGYDVEVDVRYTLSDELLLGHDKPQYLIKLNWLRKRNLWIHAKDLRTLQYLLDFKDLNCFYQEGYGTTLTSKGFIWSTDAQSSNGIFVKSSLKTKPYTSFGVCSDYVSKIKEQL